MRRVLALWGRRWVRAGSTVGLDVAVMQQVASAGSIADSALFASQVGVPHKDLVSTLMRLEGDRWVQRDQHNLVRWALTEEGEQYCDQGTPEARIHAVLARGPAEMPELRKQLGKAVVEVGMKQLMRAGAASIKERRPAPDGALLTKTEFAARCGADADRMWQNAKAESKATVVTTGSGEFADVVREQLRQVRGGAELDAKTLEALKRRKLVASQKVVRYEVVKGDRFPSPFPQGEPWPWRQHKLTDLSQATLHELWDAGSLPAMKPLNLDARGKLPHCGSGHPLMKLRQEYREIFLELGFQEMRTNQFVDSAFWNFDALFVPQQHPARDLQDTFFVSDPATSDLPDAETVSRTEEEHVGGYQYDWRKPEASRNVLRTHTTAVTAFTLRQIGREYQETGELRTGAFFSIDRVFRNEEMDRTHLCEFHQIEGCVVDYGLSLGNMMALLRQFFEKVGVPKLRFKPTYNPYTEPSMEVHGWHEELGKYIEVGNSGVFRPEMMRALGLPEEATAIAWGLGLERPAIMFYGLDNVHDLLGHRVKLPFIRSAPSVRL
eukprot:TRINITY_DN3305_c0_g1_i1.p1 TRINITY_DN3305_c0_g1~~TRINITY_DN3305_c0_g1_i1.p1  ORF type:complete len:569 (+),score=173.79 TRINITY_DN3305_c0_g1_i1:57-1709(+)